MPSTKPLQYWGPNLSTRLMYERLSSERAEEAKRQRDEEYFARWGYFPQQRAAVLRAQQEANREWEQLVQELEARQDEIRNSETARRLQDYYQGVLSGRDLPLDERTVASITSRTTNPLIRAARGNIERLRESFAARGLARSGALGSLEQRYLSDATTEAAARAGEIRANAAIENFAARERGAGGFQNLWRDRESMLNALTSELAGYRAQRSYDPNQFAQLPGQRRSADPTGGFTSGYNPPPPINRRRVGTTVPTYTSPGRSS